MNWHPAHPEVRASGWTRIPEHIEITNEGDTDDDE